MMVVMIEFCPKIEIRVQSLTNCPHSNILMRNLFRLFTFAVLAVAVLFFESCYSDNFEPEPIIIDPGEPEVSFKDEIVPVFETSCNQSICHATGAVV